MLLHYVFDVLLFPLHKLRKRYLILIKHHVTRLCLV
jgi:hypothetical protein